jgi:hypothetical protein
MVLLPVGTELTREPSSQSPRKPKGPGRRHLQPGDGASGTQKQIAESTAHRTAFGINPAFVGMEALIFDAS